MKLNLMRYSKKDEILGGDLHYFGPIKFEGELEDYEMKMIVKSLMLENIEYQALINHVPKTPRDS
jgi:hypothetical protein